MASPTKRRAGEVLRLLARKYGTEPWNWHTRQTPFRVLIGTVLSQRTRDEKTDEATKSLFSRYASPDAIAKADPEDIEGLIRSVNYYRTKAKRIREICRRLTDHYGAGVPDSLEELMKLPGVGMKTASCVLVYGFRKPAIPVDTHVHRISNRIGLIRTRTPRESEQELWQVVPQRFILLVNDLLVKHGQSICRPMKPLCSECPVVHLCEYLDPNVKSEGHNRSIRIADLTDREHARTGRHKGTK